MKDSRKSNRDLAKLLGVSQNTVTRTIKKLEKEGYIKEYTVIPDFNKLGFKMMSITFLKRPENVTAEELDKIMKLGRDIAEKEGLKTVLALRGMGLGFDVAIVSIHEDYASFLRVLDSVRKFPHSDVTSMQSFLINLADEVQYRPFTFSYLAKYFSDVAKKEMSTSETP